jgi:hypothetical protein
MPGLVSSPRDAAVGGAGAELGAVCASVKGTVAVITNAVMAAAIVSFVMCLVMCFSYVIPSRRTVVSGDAIMKISFSAASVDRSSLNPVILVHKISDLAFLERYPDTPLMSVRQRT